MFINKYKKRKEVIYLSKILEKSIMQDVYIFVCSFCKETFDSNDAIACHILNDHNGDKTVQKLKKKLEARKTSSVRSKTTANKKEMKLDEKQIRNHRREFYCDICSYKTVYLSTYKRHLLRHEKGSREHKCMYCSYAAIQPNNLKIHLEKVHPFGAVEPVIVDEDYMKKIREKFS